MYDTEQEHVGFEVLTAVTLRSITFGDVSPWSLLEVDLCLEEFTGPVFRDKK